MGTDYGKKYADEIRKENKQKKPKSPMPKKIATLQSIFLIGFIAMAICGFAINDKDETEKSLLITFLFLLIAGQVFNIIALHNNSAHSRSWLSLYLERKKLEELKKIESLTIKK